MLRKIKETVKTVVKRSRQAAVAVISALTFAYMTAPVPVYASDAYLQPVNKLKTVAISIVAAAGVIILIFGVVKFAEAFQKKDQNGEYNAVYTIVAGGIMIGVSGIITALT